MNCTGKVYFIINFINVKKAHNPFDLVAFIVIITVSFLTGSTRVFYLYKISITIVS